MTEAQEILQKHPERRIMLVRYSSNIHEAIGRYQFDTHSSKPIHEICLDALFEPLYNKYRSIFFEVFNGNRPKPGALKRSYLSSFDVEYRFYKQVKAGRQKQFRLYLPEFLIAFTEYMKIALGETVGIETLFRMLTERILINHFQYYLKAIFAEREKLAREQSQQNTLRYDTQPSKEVLLGLQQGQEQSQEERRPRKL